MCMGGSSGNKIRQARAGNTNDLQRQLASGTTYQTQKTVTDRQYFTLDGTKDSRNKYTNGRMNALYARKKGFKNAEGSKMYKDVSRTVTEDKFVANNLNRTAVADESQLRIKSRSARSGVANAEASSRRKAKKGGSLRISQTGVSTASGGSGVFFGQG